jgi:hypothetical protein
VKPGSTMCCREVVDVDAMACRAKGCKFLIDVEFKGKICSFLDRNILHVNGIVLSVQCMREG